jgi:C4-dicarboxylate-specific signal transduction histidine kinase
MASWRMLAAAALGLTIFVLDGLTGSRGAVAVLYIGCIVLVASRDAKWRLPVVGGLCTIAACIWFVKEQWDQPFDDGVARFAVSLVAIAITTLLCFVNRLAEEREDAAAERYRSIFNDAGFAVWESDWSETLALLREAESLSGDEPLEDWLAAHPDRLARAREASRLCDYNEAARRLFGFERGRRDLRVGRTALRFHGGDRALALAYARLCQGARVVELEGQLPKPSGETVELVIRLTRLQGDRPWNSILAMAMDVTARKEAQAKLDAALAELAHVSRVTTLGQMAASIVHEVNQPLSAAIAYGRSGLRWLQREGPQARETAGRLEGAVANAGRAAEVIGRVRELARKSAPRSEPVALGALIDETLGLLRREVQDRGVRVRLAIAPETPEVAGDRVQIQQVLMNLVMNATQAMDAVEPARRELALTVAPEGGLVKVSVRDRGGGLAELDERRIFDPFVTTKAHGLGIGLSICRSIVEGHGGRIWAASAGDGTEVAFTLPAVGAESGRVAWAAEA